VATTYPPDDELPLPRAAVRFPIELHTPPGFRPELSSTWPQLPGRLEYVGGTILYLPPCGGIQQAVCADLAGAVGTWVHAHPEFRAGSNEAGMKLGRDVRGADTAIWRRADHGPYTGHFPRVPPVLAVEVASAEETEAHLRAKAQWYLEASVEVVWLVLPESREVVVITADGESRHARGTAVPPHASLPELTPRVDDFFLQLDRG
jgi:Uma2 family endonuclease